MSLELCDVVGVRYLELIRTFLELFRDDSPEFSEIRESTRAHPNDEVFVLHVMPVLRLPALVETELVADIIWPCDAALVNGHLCALTSIGICVEELVGVREETARDESTGRRYRFRVEGRNFVEGHHRGELKVLVAHDGRAIRVRIGHRDDVAGELRGGF